MGYRGFEIKDLSPLFPFGYGLSYTQFEYSDFGATSVSSDGKFTVSFKIRNTGNVHGREIAQIYVTDRQSSLPRPIKELKGFIKVDLQPGETKTIDHALDREALGFYEDRAKHWIAEKGKFAVHVAASSADTRLSGEIELKESFTWTGL